MRTPFIEGTVMIMIVW